MVRPRVLVSVLLALASLSLPIVLDARPAAATVAFVGGGAGFTFAPTGIITYGMVSADGPNLAQMTYQLPNGRTWADFTALYGPNSQLPRLWLNAPQAARGWRDAGATLNVRDNPWADRQGRETLPMFVNGVITTIDAQWRPSAQGWRIKIAGEGRAVYRRGAPPAGTQVVGKVSWRSRPLAFSQPGRPLTTQDDPLNSTMDHGPIGIVVTASNTRPNVGAFRTTLLNRNAADACWYYRSSVTTQAANRGLGRLPIVFDGWTLLPGQETDPATGKCRPYIPEGVPRMLGKVRATLGMKIRLSVVERTALGAADAEYKDLDLYNGVVYETPSSKIGLVGNNRGVRGFADATPLGDDGALIIEDDYGDVYRTVLDAGGLPTGDLQRVDLRGLPGTVPVDRDTALSAANWGGRRVVISTSRTGLVVRELRSDGGQTWDLGRPPGGAALASERPVLSVSTVGSDLLSDPGVDVTLSARTTDGRLWQNELFAPTVTAKRSGILQSGWFQPLVDDPGFPVVSDVAADLRSGEVVQSWNTTPMLPASALSGYEEAGANDTRDKTELLLVKADIATLTTSTKVGWYNGATWADAAKTVDVQALYEQWRRIVLGRDPYYRTSDYLALQAAVQSQPTLDGLVDLLNRTRNGPGSTKLDPLAVFEDIDQRLAAAGLNVALLTREPEAHTELDRQLRADITAVAAKIDTAALGGGTAVPLAADADTGTLWRTYSAVLLAWVVQHPSECPPNGMVVLQKRYGLGLGAKFTGGNVVNGTDSYSDCLARLNGADFEIKNWSADLP